MEPFLAFCYEMPQISLDIGMVQLIQNQMDIVLIWKLESNLRGTNKRGIEPHVSHDRKWPSLYKILCSISSTKTEKQRWAV